MRFYLGTHMPHWLGLPDMPPLFVSHRRLRGRRTMPQASTRWALDSGGFTELSMFGRWETPAGEYVAAVERYRNEIGQLDWAAPQDWMCEPWILAKTGLTVREHQHRTIESYLELSAESDLFVPVLQGWTLGDYLDHAEMYDRAGVDLASLPVVGLGSVCRRQATAEIGSIVAQLDGAGIKLHGFGVKGDGIRRYGWALTSADSMAWSAAGRRVRPCPHRSVRRPVSCANCLPFALDWRSRFISATASTPAQLEMAL